MVVAGTGRTTAAITGVPVSTTIGSTRLNDASAPIAPALSATAMVAGTVRDASNNLLNEASVAARQSLSTSQVLDVGWAVADPDTASYSLTLPLAAPLKAVYVNNGGPLSFAADSVTPGFYSVLGSAPGYTTQVTEPAVTLGAADSTTTKNLVLAP